jgi:hypothetical protein
MPTEIFDGLRAKRAEQMIHPRLHPAFVEAVSQHGTQRTKEEVSAGWGRLDTTELTI